tara:strand:+ start:374 stop:823 length:450 start_codon:yes stop_codon:yes gene_type:complete
MYIYKIWKEDDENFYIGSTNDFSLRKCQHKSVCHNPRNEKHNRNIYKHIRENGNWDSWNMDIIEECNDRCRERELIKELKPTLNIMIYDLEDQKENKKEYSKKFYRDNTELIKLKKNEPCLCECGGKYTRCNYTKHLKTKRHQNFILHR